MSLYKQWESLISNQTDDTFGKFWEEYSEVEVAIYTDILNEPKKSFDGKIGDLIEKYKADPKIFMGFIDGIQNSLKSGTLDLEKVDENTEISFEIDFEKLYFNMLSANAEHLYSLAQWEDVLDESQRLDIIKEHKKSKTVVNETKIGRNEPCPCGSGKKYKKCCGK